MSVSNNKSDLPSTTPVSRRAETRVLLQIAMPLMGAYLAELAMFLTTKMIVGRLGYLELAAVGISADLTFEVLVVSMGLLSIVGVLVAQAEGASDRPRAGLAVRQGLLVALAIGLPAMVLVWNLDIVLRLTGQDPQVVALARPYLNALSFSVLPVLWFSVLRIFVSAIARTGIIMVITVAAVALNYALTLAFVHGLAGLPALGIAGAGWATTIVSWLMLLALTAYMFVTPALRGYGIFLERLRVHSGMCAEIVKLGLPVAGLVGLEAGMFVAMSVLSGVLSAKTLAIYQIMTGWIGIPFVVALGLAEATMVRVAHGIGRKDATATRNAGMLGMAMGAGLLAAMTIIPLTFPELIVRIYMRADDPTFTEIVALVTPLLIIAAVFQVFDGLQAVASRALRGIKDTIAPLWLAGFGYWVLGIGGGSLLAFPFGLGATGLWLGLAAGLIATGSLLAWRFERLTKIDLTLRR
ncbi:MAG: MATE family efflux transporter [Rhizobiales bacterium]|nr:MATE family efflux transporter [Hyphomicrobiales bacterium]